ncbi:MAG: tetratricopeptide repeat protein [Candidatus Margulisiibacteriota bacterium]
MSKYSPLLKEKAPFFLLAAISAVLTFIAQQKGGAVGVLGDYTFVMRITNALTAYAGYLIKMIWPFKLAVFYPHHGIPPLWQIAGSVVLLSGISVFVIRRMGKMPYLAMGWLWYLITLAPVSGIVQVGAQTMADRYTYVPLIGVFIMAVWVIPDILAGYRKIRTIIGITAIIVLLIICISSYAQVSYWQDCATLFNHNIAVTGDNAVANFNLGVFYNNQGDKDRAIINFKKVLQTNPKNEQAGYNLGLIYYKNSRLNEAGRYMKHALLIKPDEKANYYLGLIMAQQGDLGRAIEYFEAALRINPEFTPARNNLIRVQEMKKGIE